MQMRRPLADANGKRKALRLKSAGRDNRIATLEAMCASRTIYNPELLGLLAGGDTYDASRFTRQHRASKAAHNQVLVALTNYCRRVAASTERSGARSPNMFVLDVRNGLSTRALRETGTPASCCFVASRHSGTIRCLRETGLPTANTEHARAQDVLARDDAWGSVVFTSVYFDACGLS